MTGFVGWRAWSCSVRVAAPVPQLPRARAIVTGLMADVDRAVSRFRDDSDLARVNAAAGRLVPVSATTVQLVRAALDAARSSDGHVDPTLATQLVALGYDRDVEELRGRRVPTQAPTPGGAWRDVRVDERLRLVGVPAGTGLDLGATAKAWTADAAADLLHAVLDAPVLVEIGGDLAVRGTPAAPWRVDVSEVSGGPADRVDLHHGAIATSTTQARRWADLDGRPVHHLLDPATGRPVDGPWRTASVWAPTALEANTAATAALVAGFDAPERLRAAGLAARLVDRRGRVARVGAWPDAVEVAA
ncbi:MAG: FAD:protein FMN transferase [Aeromicrobium erythreum]